MNIRHNIAPILCATELSLTVALVVFVMLTLLLGAIILLLCVSKSFRAFFFREHKRDEQPHDALEADGSQVEQPATATEISPPDAATLDAPDKKPQRRKKRDDVFGGIPTVPLTLFSADDEAGKPTAATRRKKSMGDIATVEIPSVPAQDETAVYTPRTVARKRSAPVQTQAADRSARKKPRTKDK